MSMSKETSTILRSPVTSLPVAPSIGCTSSDIVLPILLRPAQIIEQFQRSRIPTDRVRHAGCVCIVTR